MARRHLRHDAPVALVRGGLRGDDVRQDPRVVGYRRAGVVAGGLDPQRIKPRPGTGRFEPHDQGVLAVVVVVAAAVAGAPKAEPLVHRDRAVVRGADLERVAGVGAGLVEQPLEQPPGDPLAAAVGADRDVHQVPDVRVARADQVAEQPLIGRGREADARRLRELEHEHRERPGRLERAALDREHGREVAVGQSSKANLGQAKSPRRGVSGRSAGSPRAQMAARPRRAGRRAGPRPGAPGSSPGGPRRPRPPAHREIVAPRIRRQGAFRQLPEPLGERLRRRHERLPRSPRRPGRTARRRPGRAARRAPPAATALVRRLRDPRGERRQRADRDHAHAERLGDRRGRWRAPPAAR